MMSLGLLLHVALCYGEGPWIYKDPQTTSVADLITVAVHVFRMPIFFVLAFGLLQVFIKLYELIRDRRVSAALAGADFASMDLDAITRLVARQEETMLSSLQSTQRARSPHSSRRISRLRQSPARWVSRISRPRSSAIISDSRSG